MAKVAATSPTSAAVSALALAVSLSITEVFHGRMVCRSAKPVPLCRGSLSA